MSRRLIIQTYRLRKQLKESDSANRCEYCGMPADSVDHFKPVSLTNMVASIGDYQRHRLLYCCRECNNLAGAAVFSSLPEKRKYIHGKIEKRYAALLRIPNWDDEDLADLGRELRRDTERSLIAKSIILQRLRWPRS